MASYNYNGIVTETFPVGTTVSLYGGDPPVNGKEPTTGHPLITGAVVASDGSLTLTVPTDTDDYFLGAQISGVWQYWLLPARYRPVQAGGGGGGTGADGKTVRAGTGAPSAGLGNEGDFYIDTAASRMYGPKSGGVWGAGVSLIGPTGPTGAAGAAGATGPTGATGATGPAGPLISRTTLTFSTSSIAVNATENDDVNTLDLASEVYSITTNRPARVRAYGTTAHRSADAARVAGTDPTGNHGCLLDVVTAGGTLTIDLAPIVTLVNMDGSPANTIYFAVQNLDVSTAIVQTTLTLRRSE